MGVLMKTIFFFVCFYALLVHSQTISPNMNMPIPIPGVTTGPAWANDINASLNIIDGHNHTPGYGVPIPPAGLNINSDLTFNNNNLTSARSLRMQAQGTSLSSASDLTELYVTGPDLYYIDGSGNNIRITQSGSVSGSAGTITGLPSGTASAAYATGTFTFQSATNTAANIDGESFILRNSSANSKGLTLNPPNAMGSNYSLYLPSLPAQQNFMTLDASGNMSAPWNVDNSTIVVSSNTLEVPVGGIGTTQIASQAVTAYNIANNTVTRAQLASVGQITSSSSLTYSSTSTSITAVTNLSDSLTVSSSARPVMILVQPDGVSPGGIYCQTSLNGLQESVVYIYRDSSIVSEAAVYCVNQSVYSVQNTVPSFTVLDVAATSGSHTYTVKIQNSSSSTTMFVTHMQLLVYEL